MYLLQLTCTYRARYYQHMTNAGKHHIMKYELGYFRKVDAGLYKLRIIHVVITHYFNARRIKKVHGTG